MKKILALIMAVAVLASMFAVSFGAAAEEKEYRVSIDSAYGQKSKDKDSADPQKHYVITAEIEQGTDFAITGWVLMTEGFQKLQYNIDGGAWKDATVSQYSVRADVHAAFPGFEANNVNIGFEGGAFFDDCKTLAVGEYTVLVRAYGKEGTTVEIAKITLKVAGEVIVPEPTVVERDIDAEEYKYSNGTQVGDPIDFLNSKAAIQFKIPEGKEATQFVFSASPTWANTAPKNAGSDVLAKIYEWKGNYDASLSGNPIDTVQIYGHADCQDLIIAFSKNIAAGEYIMALDANGGKSIGTWAAGAGGEDSTTFYTNGAAKEGYVAWFSALLVDAPKADAAPALDSHLVYNCTGGNNIGVWLKDATNELTTVFNVDKPFNELKLDVFWASNPPANGSALYNFKIGLYKFNYNVADTLAGTPVAYAEIINGNGDNNKFYNKSAAFEIAGTNMTISGADNGLRAVLGSDLPAGQYVLYIINDAGEGSYLVLPTGEGDLASVKFFRGTNEGEAIRFALNTNGQFVDVIPDREAPAPQTGDATVAMFAVIAVVALAAVVVFKKRVVSC